MFFILKGTILECGRILLARLGHDPYGMRHNGVSWRRIVSKVYVQKRDFARKRWEIY